MTTNASAKDPRKLPFALARAVDQACDRFEAAWQAGGRPAIEGFLADVPTEARDILRDELIGLEVRCRRRAGETPQAQDYTGRFPSLDPARLAGVLKAAQESDTAPHAPRTPDVGDGGWPVIPGYEILGVLGEGGMGVVYKARHLTLQRLVAVKMILPARPADTPTLLARFRAEAEAQARLQHPNIVQIFEVAEVAGRPYLALEYLDGGSLDRRLRGTPQPPRRAARLVEMLACAVHAAHQAQIVHRDLKPANVLLQPVLGVESAGARGGAGAPAVDLDHWIPKITDFGVAKFLDADRGQTQTGSVLGTPSYMAPEQARGRTRDIGPATDIYALGAILYELLTGRPPFKGASSQETLEQVVHQDPVSPKRLQPKVPGDLVTICLRCLEKEPQQRYPNAGALAEDLNRFLSGRPILIRPIGRGERLWRWCRRHPARAVAGALTMLVLITVSILAVGIPFAVRLAASHRRIDSLLFRQTLEFNAGVCERGDVGRGLLLLAHSLQNAPEGTEDLQRVIRADLAFWSRELYAPTALLNHEHPILTVAWSPDGRLLLTGGRGPTVPDEAPVGEARLWDAATGRLLATLPHAKTVRAAAFTRDGRRVVTGSEDNRVRLWDTATGKLVWERRHADQDNDDYRVMAVAISPDPDSRTVLTGSWDTTVRRWETDTGQPVGEPLKGCGRVRAVAFRPPDGSAILFGSANMTAQLWEVPAEGRSWGKGPRRRFQHPSPVWAVAFSPDGSFATVGDADGFIHVWDANTGRRWQRRFQAHQNYITAVALSPDGRKLLTASEDTTAQLWDTETGEPSGPRLRHPGRAVWGVAFHPKDGRQFLTGGWDGMARLWERGSLYRPVRQLPFGRPVLAVDVNRVDKTVLIAGRVEPPQLWDLDDGPEPRIRRIPFPPRAPGSTVNVPAAVFSRDGRLLLTGCSDTVARLWGVSEAGVQLLRELPGHTKEVVAVAFSPDGRRLLTGSLDGSARRWDAKTGEQQLPEVWHQKNLGLLHAVAFSPDGATFVTGASDMTARLWDAETGAARPGIFRHASTVRAVAFSADGRTLLTGTLDGTAWLWDVATGKGRRTPELHTAQISSVAFHPDGRTFLTGSTDGTARLWDVATLEPIGPPLRHNNWVYAVAFHPDGRLALTGCKDKAAYLWELPDPVEGSASRIVLWVEVLTGMKLDGDGVLRTLDAATWEQRRRQLAELGGPPRTVHGMNTSYPDGRRQGR